MYTEEDLQHGFTVGEWEIYPGLGVFRCGDNEEKPAPKEFALMCLLAQADGNIVSLDEIIEKVWDNRALSNEPVQQAVSKLRQAIGDRDRSKSDKYIENVSRRGYRLTPEIRLISSPEATVQDAPPVQQAKPSYALPIAGAGVLVVALVWFLTTVIVSKDVQSIGVMPFSNLSSDSSNDYLVQGLKNELIHTLHNAENLSVVDVNALYEGQALDEVASELNVDSLLKGAVQQENGVLRVTYTVTGDENEVLSSGMIEGQVQEHFDLQEQLAREVVSDLFGEDSEKPVSSSRPASFQAYDRYMRGLYALDNRQVSTSLDDAIELLKQTIELDPDFGPAYLKLATAYVLLPTYRPVEFREANQMALDTIERGVEVDPSITDAAQAVYGFVYHKQKKWQESENAYLRATNARVVDATALNWYSRMLSSVGRLDDSLQQAERALELEPASAIINSRMALAHTWLGNTEEAAEYFVRAQDLGAGGSTHLMGNALFLFRKGEVEKAYALTVNVAQNAGLTLSWIDPVFAGLADPDKAGEALAAVDAAVASQQMSPQIELIVRNLFGDLEGAMGVAGQLRAEGEIFEMDLLFIPELESLRGHQGFDGLMSDLGVSDYWSRNDCSWQGDSVRCSPAN